MKKKLAAVVTAAMAMAAVAAGPASADEIDGDELLFLGYPAYSVMDDVDYENVRERNHKDGDCLADDVDRDGLVAAYELTCFY
jgi:opacity protein-like surface antigen